MKYTSLGTKWGRFVKGISLGSFITMAITLNQCMRKSAIPILTTACAPSSVANGGMLITIRTLYLPMATGRMQINSFMDGIYNQNPAILMDEAWPILNVIG